MKHLEITTTSYILLDFWKIPSIFDKQTFFFYPSKDGIS